MASAPAPSDGGSVTTTMAICGVVIVLAIIFVALRFYIRIFTRAGLGYDDWLILLGVVTILIIMVLLLVGNAIDPDGLQVVENADPNYFYAPADKLYVTYSFAAATLYFTAVSATKLGILFMYYRIFARSAAFRYQLFISGGLVLCWWIISTVLAITNCLPLEINVQGTIDDPRYCRNYNVFWMAAGVCEIFIDTLILSLPVGVVLRMGLSLRQKLAVSGIFMLGSFVIITGIVKVILGYDPPKRAPSFSQTEIWAGIHTCIATISACLPIFRPLIHRIAKSSFVTKTSTILSIRRQIESRQSERRCIIESSRNHDGNERGGDVVMELSHALPSGEIVILQGPLQQPSAAHMVSSSDQFDDLLLPREYPQDGRQSRLQRRSRVETAESFMTVQLASYLEYGTDSSETLDLYDGRDKN
ncbi:uncharacterized protein GGS22DRAFT_120698 [Annulohypoxylon maeteangense]|uniref:uncharacterized protein n=1 Tax=Annulohypoxylon maeteangense TaxID=1927788 RepID=UPI0020089A4E|nr:uncharacterized protein GGS22DRAFT_120698 [Annulohypoxylon maeteangense]KAI0887036.1 hypothetical protein GGS22DRAFT_120698 [Annulohypoxylon maeteangense]